MGRLIGNTRLIRSYNASTVLQTLHKHGSCSRSQLTKLTGLSAATITRIISDLLEQGVVREGRVGRSTGGRKPVYIHIDHAKLYIASVKLLQDDCTVALLDLGGKILGRKQLQPCTLEAEPLLAEVATALDNLLEQYMINRQHILGLGVAISGICCAEQGAVLHSVNLGWKEVPVAAILSEDFDLPIFIENDANACALAELWFGAAKDTLNSMYIKTETGAGAGVILNQTLLTGPRFMSGEIGHVPLIQDGYPCRCGQLGCLEPYVYWGDVQARYERQTGNRLEADQFVEMIHRKDPAALKIARETAHALARACAHWGILLDLDVITIGGFWGFLKKDIINYCQIYYCSILEQTGVSCHATITGSRFGDDADLLGAAGLVIDNWLTPASAPLDR